MRSFPSSRRELPDEQQGPCRDIRQRRTPSGGQRSLPFRRLAWTCGAARATLCPRQTNRRREHRLTRIAEPDLDVNAGLVTVNYTVLAESKINGRLTTFGEVHRMRYLFPSEVELLATQTGFRVEHSEQFLTGMPPSENSWGVTYFLQKRRQPSNDLYSRERTVAEWKREEVSRRVH